jgi:DNA-binding MarR family transcriptional regulator
MDRDEALRLDNQFCFAVYACAREVTKLYKPFLDELGLTYTQYVTMLALWEKDHVSVKELGERLYLDSGTLTPLLKKLEKAGYVNRARDAKDERNVIVRLTAQGIELKQQAFDVPMKVNCGTNLPVREMENLRDQLKLVIDQIHTKKTEAET